MNGEPTTLLPELLTPADVRRIFQIGESTEAAWRAEKPPVISFFRRGRVILYPREAVLAAIVQNTVRARGKAETLKAEMLDAGAWARIERLIEQKLKAEIKLEKAA